MRSSDTRLSKPLSRWRQISLGAAVRCEGCHSPCRARPKAGHVSDELAAVITASMPNWKDSIAANL